MEQGDGRDVTPAGEFRGGDGVFKGPAAGPMDEALTAENLSETFDLALTLKQEDGRYTARAL